MNCAGVRLATLRYSGFGVKAVLKLAGVLGGRSRVWAAGRSLGLRAMAPIAAIKLALVPRIARLGLNRTLTYLLTALLFVTLIASGCGIMNGTWRQIVEAEAQARALGLNDYLSDHMPDLADVMRGKPASPASLAFLKQAQSDDGVVRLGIFGDAGQRRYPLDATQSSFQTGDGSLAAAALASGRIEQSRYRGAGAPAGSYLVAAVMPVMDQGRAIGAVDVLIDMTTSSNAVLKVLINATLSFGLILAVAFGVPGIGFWLRTRQKELAEHKLDFLSQHDALTSLPNRASLMRRLSTLLPADTGQPKGIAVLAMGLDHFKEINGSLGHEAGDQLLRDVADRLNGALAPGEFATRAGGDEFVIVKDCSDDCSIQVDCATELAQRLIKSFTRPFQVRDAATRVSPSIGIAGCPEDGIDPETLIKNANLALQAVKAGGRGTFRFYDGAMDEQSQRRRAVARQVRVACETDGFLLNYQPVYSLSTGLLSGFEALVRLPQADGGMVSPAEFIPAAEDLGLITKIGTFVLETACQQAALWPDDLTMAINISPAEFREGRVVERVAAALARSGLKPERLEVEVTEGVLLVDTETTRRTMDGLKKLGVAIVLDDFGTGYSSLSYLWQFRFDKLKIDQSFVRAIGKGNNVTDIIRTIIALGRALDLRVTAEGVETEAQAAVLKAMRCDLVQGYLYGKPVAQPDVPAYVARPLPGSLAAAAMA